MPKTSVLPEDTQPTSDDFTLSLDILTGALKKVKWQNLRSIFASKRVTVVQSSSTISPNFDTTDTLVVSALATDTSISAPTGTPTEGQPFLVRIRDDGTARGINWNAAYRGIGVSLPGATVANKVLYIGMINNSQDGTIDVISVGRQG